MRRKVEVNLMSVILIVMWGLWATTMIIVKPSRSDVFHIVSSQAPYIADQEFLMDSATENAKRQTELMEELVDLLRAERAAGEVQ